jgi:NTP pyrophosphatase (non-canonical NTP hydrolase)
LNLKEIQRVIDDWIGKNGGYYSELTNLARLTEELGELARLYARREIPARDLEDVSRHKMQEEMGDIVFALCVLANQAGIDLETSVQDVLNKVKLRDADRH